MKGLGVYYHCAKAEFVPAFGPRAMGASPNKHSGLIYVLYNIQGSWGSPQKKTIHEKVDQHNDLNDIIACLFAQ